MSNSNILNLDKAINEGAIAAKVLQSLALKSSDRSLQSLANSLQTNVENLKTIKESLLKKESHE